MIARLAHSRALSLGGVKVRGANLENAERVVTGTRAGIRTCYQRGLAESRKVTGRLRLSLDVDAQGDVVGATAKAEGGAREASVTACIVERVKQAKFVLPDGSDSARIEFTATFTSDTPGTR